MCYLCAQLNPQDSLSGYDLHLGPSGSAAGASTSALGERFWVGIAAGSESADAPESTATTYSLQVGQSFYGTLDSSTDEDWIAIDLVAGQTYDFRLLGQGRTFLSDPFLRIRDSAGASLNSNDDGFTSGSNTHELDSRLVFTATYTGTYYLEADAFGTQTGDYLLTATNHDPNGMVFTADEIAWQLTNNGEVFFGSTEAAAFNVGVDGALTVNLTALTTEGQYLARQALQAWTNVTGIIFQETAGAAEITFDDSDAGTTAFANTNISGGAITSSSVMITTGWLTQFGTTLNSYSFETYIHEIGHALGLAHGGNYNGSATYGVDNYYLNDSLAWSIMSYMQAENDEFDFGGPSDWNTFVDASFRYLVTPQIADIIAIQNLYGDFNGAFTGNTTWGFNSNTGVEALDTAVDSGALMAMTVYDSGGIDTLNFANANASQVISLLAESMSSVLGGRHNLSIARGVVIENANGGSGADTMIGNAVSNIFYGHNGNDILDGGEGNDMLVGGLGADQHIGGAGRDFVHYSDGNYGDLTVRLDNPALNVGAAAVGDTYVGIEWLAAGTGNDTVVGDNLANGLFGLEGTDTILGRDGNDILGGDDGNDHLYGGLGADEHNGGLGLDFARYDDANYGNLTIRLDNSALNVGAAAVGDTYFLIECLVAGVGNDTVVGDNLANRLFGQGGTDTIIGRDGNDILDGGIGNDHLYGGLGADQHIGGDGLDFARYDDANYGNLTIRLDNAALNVGAAAVGDTYVGIECLVGGLGNDTVVGDTFDNRLYGQGGTDTIYGQAGTDILDGGAGNDFLAGGLGNDTLTGGGDNDTFFFNTTLNAATNVDRITDFSVPNDTIRLEDAIFTAIGPVGTLAAAAFTIGAAATTAAHRIVYNSATGALIYDSNGSAAGGATQFAILGTGLALTNADFLVT
ncbi:Serralysin [Rhizobiaceae bacterium]|nr:Serralysin [Rhizobiaceae bacterium]